MSLAMANIDDVDDKMVREIRQATKDCTERGLVVAAKWYVPSHSVLAFK
jgi:hypothetical protein